MKRILFYVFGMCLLFPIAITHAEILIKESSDGKEAPQMLGKCPKTGVMGEVDSCLKCHVQGDFRLKETPVDAHLTYPMYGMNFVFEKSIPIKTEYAMKDIDGDAIVKVLRYSEEHGVKHVVFNIYSPGGSLFGAWRIVHLMQEWQNNPDHIIETRCRGFAASAAFLVLVSGTPGHRYIGEHAELMWHELISFKMFDISTPSDKEEEARILRHFQDSGNTWIAAHSKITKDELDQLIRKKEFWITGQDAVEKYGFADHVIK